MKNEKVKNGGIFFFMTHFIPIFPVIFHIIIIIIVFIIIINGIVE